MNNETITIRKQHVLEPMIQEMKVTTTLVIFIAEQNRQLILDRWKGIVKWDMLGPSNLRNLNQLHKFIIFFASPRSQIAFKMRGAATCSSTFYSIDKS